MISKRSFALDILKDLNPAQFWIFVMLRSVVDKNGKVRRGFALKDISMMVNFADIGDGRRLKVSVDDIRYRIAEMTYMGIIKADPASEPNDDRKVRKYAIPIQIEKDFLDFVPSKYSSAEIAEKLALLELKVEKADELKRAANDTVRRLREELRILKSRELPEFKLFKKDGTPDKRSVKYQKLWAWFVLLDIQPAFEKVMVSDGVAKKTPDYKTMAIWVATFGYEEIEALLHTFYMNKRLDDLKIDAGDKWPQVVLRFIYGALRKNAGNKKVNKNDMETSYVPRRGWEDDGE